jgi:PTS system cellobiose-specific IIB component
MKKVLIICAAGMSSSLIAKKGTSFLTTEGWSVRIDAISASEGIATIAKDDYDLYLVSPQTKMHFANLKKSADKYGNIPIPIGIEKLAQLVKESIALEKSTK